jgi:hypothetical protein
MRLSPGSQVLVRTGRGRESESALSSLNPSAAASGGAGGGGGARPRFPPPLGVVDDLSAAADLIIRSLG